MTVPTAVRAGRAAALFAKFQTGLGSAATSFAASNRLWQTAVGKMTDSRFPHDASMHITAGPPSAATYRQPARVTGEIEFHATPTSLDIALRSALGTGYAIDSQIAAANRLTLAWVEDVGGTQRVVRVKDAWFYEISIDIPSRGKALVRARYAAGGDPIIATYAASGCTFPADPAMPSDKEIYPGPTATWVRDPLVAAVELRFARLALEIKSGLRFDYSQATGGYEVYKRGVTRAEISWDGDYSDESWTVLTNALAGTAQRYRARLLAEDGGTATFTMHNLLLDFGDGPGARGREYARQRARGEAAMDDSGNFFSAAIA